MLDLELTWMVEIASTLAQCLLYYLGSHSEHMGVQGCISGIYYTPWVHLVNLLPQPATLKISCVQALPRSLFCSNSCLFGPVHAPRYSYCRRILGFQPYGSTLKVRDGQYLFISCTDVPKFRDDWCFTLRIRWGYSSGWCFWNHVSYGHFHLGNCLSWESCFD